MLIARMGWIVGGVVRHYKGNWGMGEREVFEGMVAKFLLNLPREEQ
jgi:hypothetical protein